MAIRYSPSIVTNGLVLALDVANIKSYFSGSSNFNDISGNANNGTFPNGIGFNSLNGGNLTFNGTSQYVNCGTGLSQAGSFSISCWLKRTGIQPSNGGVICGRSAGPSGYEQNYLLSVSASASPVIVFSQSSDTYKSIKATTILTNNSWYYTTGTYNTNTNTLSVYVNTVLESTGALVTDPPTTGPQYFLVGASDGTSPANWFTGSVSIITVYNRVLSQSEIQQNYNATKARFGL
jgi:hypothetical protein